MHHFDFHSLPHCCHAATPAGYHDNSRLCSQRASIVVLLHFLDKRSGKLFYFTIRALNASLLELRINLDLLQSTGSGSLGQVDPLFSTARIVENCAVDLSPNLSHSL